MAVLSLTAARQRGFDIEADLVPKQVDFSLKTFRNRAQIAKGQGVGGDSTGVVASWQHVSYIRTLLRMSN